MAAVFVEDSEAKRRFDPRLVFWLFSFLRGRRYLAWMSLALILGGTFISLAGPWVTKLIIDDSITRRDDKNFVNLVLILATLHLTTFVVKGLQVVSMSLLGQTLMSRLRLDVFFHMLRLPKSYFDKNATGKLMTRVTSDVEALNELLTSGLLIFVGDGILLLGIVIFLFIVNWQLALVTLSVLPLVALAFVWFRRRVSRLYRTERDIVARLNTSLQESISGMGVIQLFRRQDISAKEFSDVNEESYLNSRKSVISYTLFFPFVSFQSALAKALVVWYGGTCYLNSSMTIGEMVAFLGYVQMFFGPLHDMSEKYNVFQAAMAASEKVKSVFLETISPEYQVSAEAFRPETVRGEIEFRDVWFAYSGENWVLRGLTFHVSPGTAVALVGQTGSGKTTLINLIGRFYEVGRGSILLDGVDVRDWDIEVLRRHLGIVLQDVFLFSGTLAENISLHDGSLSQETLMGAVRELGAESFVAGLPQGLSTPALERGKSLSVGQRQLLAFARTMLRAPSVLILDEATANVDTETEKFMQQATTRITRGRTAVVIAHRLSTIRSADKILVMHRGLIRESGSHDELMVMQGIYRDLYELQYRDQEDSCRNCPSN